MVKIPESIPIIVTMRQKSSSSHLATVLLFEVFTGERQLVA